MKKLYARTRQGLGRFISRQLAKRGFVRAEDFTRPYIVRKHTEGVDYLFAIRDRHARLWYDLHSGDPDWAEMRFIRDHLVRPGDTVLECGSHHGCTAILLAHWVGPGGKIYAFEPGRNNFAALEENIALNGIENIMPVNKAVGDAAGQVRFVEFPDQSMGSKVCSGQAGHAPGLADAYDVEQVALDVFANLNPSLIKLDTQGYVYQPLAGARALIGQQKPHLALEIDGKSEVDKYGGGFEEIFKIIDHDEYRYYVQFESEAPRETDLKAVIPAWEKFNRMSRDIHLFARNTLRRGQ